MGKNKEEVRDKEIVPYPQSERLQQAIFLNKAAPTGYLTIQDKTKRVWCFRLVCVRSSKERIYTFYFVCSTRLLLTTSA